MLTRAPSRPLRTSLRARPSISSPADPSTPLVRSSGDGPTVTIVIATRPGPVLGSSARRRLLGRLSVVQRRLRHAGVPLPARRALLARLRRLAAAARQLPVGDGLALVASLEDSALVHLRHPVRARTLIGPAPSRLDLADEAAVPERLALLVLTVDRARLIVVDGAVPREVVGGDFPLVRHQHQGVPVLLTSYLEQIRSSVARSLPRRSTLVVAGDERLAAAYADRAPGGSAIAGVLPGDHRGTSPLILLAVARRHLHRSLSTPQRRALAEVVVARTDGRLVAGMEDVRRAVGVGGAPLLVLERGLRLEHLRSVDGLTGAVEDRGGRVVVVPEGRLVDCDRIALVSDVPDLGGGGAS